MEPGSTCIQSPQRWTLGGALLACLLMMVAASARADEPAAVPDAASAAAHRPHRPADWAGHGAGLIGPGFMHWVEQTDATPAQRAQVQGILKAAQADLSPQHQAAAAEHAQWMQMFAEPIVDEAAAEVLRQQALTRQDTESRRMTRALVDIGQVLTQPQRQQITQLMAAHAGQHATRHEGAHAHPVQSTNPTGTLPPAGV
jgi:Spy/CpxP family protein refolding chaperone